MSSAKESRIDYVNTDPWKRSKVIDNQTQEESLNKYDLPKDPKTKKMPQKSLLQDPDHS
jgi:hypothetical protein